MTSSDMHAVVTALEELPGVARAAVEPEDSGPGVLRLTLDPGVDDAKVVAAVGRLLRERFTLGIDTDRIQLVEDATLDEGHDQVHDESHEQGHEQGHEEHGSGERHPRPSIQRMHLVSSGLDITASVTLSHDGRSSAGEASGTATQTGVHRAVATATLHAVEGLLQRRVRFELELVEVAPTGQDRTALVAITMVSAGGSEKLTGAAVVREDARQAVIRATLDAVNRRVEPLLRPAS